jgi:hypothetical protein
MLSLVRVAVVGTSHLGTEGELDQIDTHLGQLGRGQSSESGGYAHVTYLRLISVRPINGSMGRRLGRGLKMVSRLGRVVHAGLDVRVG